MSSATGRLWETAPQLSPAQFATHSKWSRLIVQLLANRGLTEVSDLEAFMVGDGGCTGDPWLLAGMYAAVSRIANAVECGEPITIFGDYDADGVTAAVLLKEVLEALGAVAEPVIPKRSRGYGLSLTDVAEIAASGSKLVITVDCGISAAKEIAAASGLGVDFIVTDHHQMTRELPPAVALINPRQPGCQYPFKELAGVGMAFKLAQALMSALPELLSKPSHELERSILDLVAIGTIADMVPLIGENRTLVWQGMAELNRTQRPGLRQLAALAGLRLGHIGSRDVGYVIAPRINAAGRLGDADDALSLLQASADDGLRLAYRLEEANRERQRLTEVALAHARQEILEEGLSSNLLMAVSDEYPIGVVGLVAGRLAEEFYRPALVVGLNGEEARGSARSIAEFDIGAALADCRDLLLRFGGHARAAGFTTVRGNLDLLRNRLESRIEDLCADLELSPKIEVDAEINLRSIDWELYEEMQRLEPFGVGNPEPVFLTRGLRVLAARRVGRSAPGHLKLTLYDGNRRWPAIAFGLGDHANNISQLIDIVYHLNVNWWDGARMLQLRLLDLKPAS